MAINYGFTIDAVHQCGHKDEITTIHAWRNHAEILKARARASESLCRACRKS